MERITRHVSTRFIKFGLVGLSNTGVAYGVYTLVVYSGFHYQAANILAFIVSSLSGFLLNKFLVFKANTEKTVFQIIRYYIVYCSSLLIGMFLSFVWIELCGANQYAAPLLNLLVTVPYNYFLSKRWVYI